MKPFILLPLGLLITTCITYFSIQTTDSREAYLMVDDTNTGIPSINAASLYKSMGLHGTTWDRVIVHILALNEIDINRVHTIVLEGRKKLLSNPIQRKNEIATFLQQIDSILTSVKQSKKGLPKSNIVLPVVHHLNELSKSKAIHKSAYIISDVFQNTDDFSAYDNQRLLQLADNPTQFNDLFKATEPLSNLSGIAIHIVYEATASDNMRFRIMSTCFQQLFEQAGGTVTIQANLNSSK